MFERAVKGYTKRSSNCKGIEATFATAEAQQEFLKPLEEAKKDVGKVNTEAVMYICTKNQLCFKENKIKIHAKEKKLEQTAQLYLKQYENH